MSNQNMVDTIPSASSSNNSNTDECDIITIDTHKELDTHKEQHDIPHKKKVVWSQENEMIMVEWCDVAQCYKWLNSRAHANYSYLHAWFTIPAIIFSTVSGTASFAQDSLPPTARAFAPAIIGSINILIGILTTIQQYLKISELNEAHRVSAISWDKLARNIRIELSKLPSERTDAGIFIKHSRSEFDRLMETSPDINEKTILEFKFKFSGKEGTEKRRQYELLKKPDICDTIISANETRHKWYLETDDNEPSADPNERAIKQKNLLILQQQMQLNARDNELNAKAEMEYQTVRKQLENQKNKQEQLIERDKYINDRIGHINMYVTNFIEIYQRKPLREEILDNLAASIDTDILDIFFASYNTSDNI
tara:strand:+ start:664 stop:1764 length:1101 start_codon:yes stop_codon:yes gene_type:complete